MFCKKTVYLKILKIHYETLKITLRRKCPYSELFWLVFSRIWTEYREMGSISPYAVQMRENADQNNSDYGHLRSIIYQSDTYYEDLLELSNSVSIRQNICGVYLQKFMKALLINLPWYSKSNIK